MIEIVTETNDQGCHLVISHQLNQDGYFRKCVGGVLTMYHRHIYETEVGAIPHEHEVDHMCRNRNCINPDHLQTLTREAHLIKTNTERYAERQEAAKLDWKTHDITGTDLAELFGVSFSIGCRWIRQWKQET